MQQSDSVNEGEVFVETENLFELFSGLTFDSEICCNIISSGGDDSTSARDSSRQYEKSELD